MNVIISSNSTHWTLIFQFSTYFEQIMSIFGKNHKILFITLKPLWIDAATWLNSMYSRHVFTLENINRKWPTFVCMQTESDFFHYIVQPSEVSPYEDMKGTSIEIVCDWRVKMPRNSWLFSETCILYELTLKHSNVESMNFDRRANCRVNKTTHKRRATRIQMLFINFDTLRIGWNLISYRHSIWSSVL